LGLEGERGVDVESEESARAESTRDAAEYLRQVPAVVEVVQRGEEVARYLPNSRHVIIPQAGHGIDGLAEPECADRIIMEFMEKGEAKDLDVGCIERMVRPPFEKRSH
jgi:hypothetical protein